MKDSKITKKPSLTSRILSAAILLLVIPLILQSLFLYRQEYAQKLEDVKEILDLFAKERAKAIEEQIHAGWTLLDFISQNQENTLKQGRIRRIPLPRGVPDRFAIPSYSSPVILVGKKESKEAALVVSISYEDLVRAVEFPYPVQLALVDDKGNAFAENRKLGEEEAILRVRQTIPGAAFSLLAALSEEAVKDLHKKDYYYRFATLLFFVGVLGGFSVYLLARRMARPLRNLCKTMDRVSEGALHARYMPDWMGFEINALGVQFNETLNAMLAHAEEAGRERIIRERLAEELRIGHEIQAALLPPSAGVRGVEIVRKFFPAKEVNGDFFDLFKLENGQLLIAMCDTAGKGISACLYSLGLRSILRSLASVTSDLEEIVLRANDLFFLDTRESGMFATLWIGIYDPKTALLTYCTQGHPPALLRRGETIQELWTNGISLGAQKLDAVSIEKIQLSPKDLLVLYTDGIIEAHNPNNQLFGQKRLQEFLLRKKTEAPPQLADRLIQEVQLFCDSAPQHDDMTLLLIYIN